jgi:predicted ATP-grasp superfamily ATP-dependent carboligase
MTAASRHCSGEITIPAEGDPIPAVLDAVRRYRLGGFIPMTDASAELGLALREAAPELLVIFPEARAYREISDKARLLELGTELGIPVPEQTVVHSKPNEGGLNGACAGVRYPVVAKPSRSAVEEGGVVHRFGVTMVADESELRAALSSYHPAAFPVLLQRRIDGPGLGAFALFWKGQPVRWFAHRRIREKPPTGGVSVYRESVPLRDDLREYATRILGHFGWSGVAMVEFKEDSNTGTPYLMEVNGRFWGSLQLALDAGVDFPAHLVTLTEGGQVGPDRGYPAGIRTRWLLGDLDHLIWMLRTPYSVRKGYDQLPSVLAALSTFLIPWRPGERWEVLSLDDPRPFFIEIREWLRALL